MTVRTSPLCDCQAFVTNTVRAVSGQTMAEYAVVLGVISLIVVTAFGLLSTAIGNAILTPITAL